MTQKFTASLKGVFFPAVMTLWSNWAPPMERSKLLSISFAGNQAGNIICLAAAGFLCEHGFAGGWPSIFYATGLAKTR
ncbi:unnamed protein product [Soboliphyme baturini]|uniref:MFS domain-containing protein n=1 Tax=Soboliphyme baturini TaxID=241478 RepID=A0A183JAF8_9BILA|nr:unnamed protein product [Soboliphyme baturini]